MTSVQLYDKPCKVRLQNESADSDDKKAINHAVLTSFQTPKFFLDRAFTDALQRKARGQNYLTWLAGNWNTVYEGRQEWRNKNVKKYVDTLLMVQQFEGSPDEVLNQILNIKGVGFKGRSGESIVDALIAKTKGSPEAMDMLFEEASNGQVSDEDIKNLALAPIAPLRGLIGEYEDLSPALDYIAELQGVAEKKSYKDDPDGEDKAKPAVTIDTCHGWKGLEAKHMWVPMAGGVFPHARSVGDEELASERRLAYVALTRGRDNVTVICPKVNHIGKPAGVSQFVTEACIQSFEEGQDGRGGETLPSKTASDKVYANWVETADFEANLTEEEWAEYDLASSYGERLNHG